MHIKFSPQRNDDILEYEFKENKIIATYKEIELQSIFNEETQQYEQQENVIAQQTDTFDFTDFIQDGIVENINTTLPVNPILQAKREDGQLYITLLTYHGANAIYDERFPKDMEV